MKNKMQALTCLMVVLLSVSLFGTTAFASGAAPASMPVAATPEPTLEPGEPMEEGSEISTRDLLYDKATNKQFITIQDRDGNTFYLVIDYDAVVNEEEEQYQTYFLNPVDIDDLASLAEQDNTQPIVCTCTERCQAGAVNMECELCAQDMTACVGKEPEPEVPEETPVPEEQEPSPEPVGLNPVILLAVLAVLAGGGALAYFKLVKNKPKTKGNDNLDDYDYGEDDTDQEDEDPWETEETDEPDADGGSDEESEDKTV